MKLKRRYLRRLILEAMDAEMLKKLTRGDVPDIDNASKTYTSPVPPWKIRDLEKNARAGNLTQDEINFIKRIGDWKPLFDKETVKMIEDLTSHKDIGMRRQGRELASIMGAHEGDFDFEEIKGVKAIHPASTVKEMATGILNIRDPGQEIKITPRNTMKYASKVYDFVLRQKQKAHKKGLLKRGMPIGFLVDSGGHMRVVNLDNVLNVIKGQWRYEPDTLLDLISYINRNPTSGLYINDTVKVLPPGGFSENTSGRDGEDHLILFTHKN